MTSSWTAAEFADLESTMKAVSIFATLRADLMRARAFMVRSTLEPTSLDKGGPRRFVGVEEKNQGHVRRSSLPPEALHLGARTRRAPRHALRGDACTAGSHDDGQAQAVACEVPGAMTRATALRIAGWFARLEGLRL